MVNYDSDSSEGGDLDYTETNVLLGYASKELTEADDVNSFIGGRPTWIDPATAPSASLARCRICNDHLTLLLQLNGDLPKDFPGHERRLYVFTCRRKTCRRKEGSIRAIRGVRISPEAAALAAAKAEAAEKKTEKPAIGGQGKVVSNTMFGDSLFGAKPASSTGGGIFGANPFSSGEGASTSPFTQSNPLSAQKPAEKPAEKPMSPTADLPKTFAAALNITSPPPSAPQPAEPWPQDSDLPKPYPLLYLADADYEQLDKDEPAPLQKFEMMELDTEPSGSGGGKEDKDVYESSIDTTFQKFADRLAQNPEQVVRYEFRGSPLLYTKGDGVGKLLGGEKGKGMPNCPNCKSKRVFEVQCAPHMITELEVEELSLEGMEWGTIIVGVCGADCCPNVRPGQVGYVEEWVGVQWEEVEDRKR